MASQDLEELEYCRGIKDKVFLWLAEKCVAGDDQFKMSDLKDHFKTLSPQLLQTACDTLLTEKKVNIITNTLSSTSDGS
jgi:hypothetical protein